MISLEGQIAIAFLLDALVGDPRWLPHPVRGIGAVARFSEQCFRRLLLVPAPPVSGAGAAVIAPSRTAASLRQFEPPAPAAYEYLAGWLSVATTLAVVVGFGVSVLAAARRVHPLLADLWGIYLVCSCVALRDLCAHAQRVYRALMTQTLDAARQRVSMIVGRDTDHLDEAGVAKAAVESVAESFVDGVTAPLFFAIVFGPLGALVYRVTNTLDSMFGYRNERYHRFGWSAAKLDDCANYLPARLSAPVLAIAAGALGYSMRSAFRILRRDGRNHPSPNAGLSEAAMAGALRIQFGGTSHYFGRPVEKPTIGDFGRPVSARDIRRAIRIVAVASVLFVVVALSARIVLCNGLPVASEIWPGRSGATSRIAEEVR